MNNKNKFWQISLYLINIVAIAQSIYFAHPAIAMLVFYLLLLSQWLVYREEYLLKRRRKRLLDVLSRCDPSSLEVFETIRDAMSQGMLSVAEVSEVLSTLINTPDKPSPPLKECQSCRFWHGKNNIVCAVRPSGYEGDDCTDFEEKP